MTATIQVRTNKAIKRSAQRILHKLGLDMSTAINMFLSQIIVHKGIPFRILTENYLTPKQEEEILKDIEWAKKHGKRYSSAKELFEDILKE